MAKHPVAGRVKTRLAQAIGPDAACRLYRAFVGDLAERLAATGWPVTWAVWPPDAPFADVVPGAVCLPQEGATLGDRLAHVTAAALAEPGAPTAVIGADAPHVDLAAIAAAAHALRTGADVALGPATDGGYYLIALRTPHPVLFEHIAWSTPTVLDDTVARAKAAGLRVHLGPPTFDVDEPADLAKLRTLLNSGAVSLPRTTAVLSALSECP